MKTYPPGLRNHRLLRVWAAPGPQKPFQKGEGAATQPFGMVSGAPEAVQNSKVNDFWVPEIGFHN